MKKKEEVKKHCFVPSVFTEKAAENIIIISLKHQIKFVTPFLSNGPSGVAVLVASRCRWRHCANMFVIFQHVSPLCFFYMHLNLSFFCFVLSSPCFPMRGLSLMSHLSQLQLIRMSPLVFEGVTWPSRTKHLKWGAAVQNYPTGVKLWSGGQIWLAGSFIVARGAISNRCWSLLPVFYGTTHNMKVQILFFWYFAASIRIS